MLKGAVQNLQGCIGGTVAKGFYVCVHSKVYKQSSEQQTEDTSKHVLVYTAMQNVVGGEKLLRNI